MPAVPDVAVVDISLKGGNGLELIKNIKARYPDLPLLVLSMHDETLYAERALRAGSLGYIMKEEAIEKVIAAIRQVIGGDILHSVQERLSAFAVWQLPRNALLWSNVRCRKDCGFSKPR